VYDHAHNLDLLSKIQLETSGRFQKVLSAMICKENELRARYVHKAVSGIGTDEMMLIDIIMTATPEQVKDIQAEYKKHFLIPMQLRVDLDTSGKFQKILDAILTGTRPAHGIEMTRWRETSRCCTRPPRESWEPTRLPFSTLWPTDPRSTWST
jgi:hypothetical protein